MASVHWGDGVLTLNNGEAHKFRIIGGKLIETGFGETHLKGTVYSLKDIRYFEGIYYGSPSQSALVKGPKAGITAKNSSNCVYIHGESATQGVRLSAPAPGGVQIKLADWPLNRAVVTECSRAGHDHRRAPRPRPPCGGPREFVLAYPNEFPDAQIRVSSGECRFNRPRLDI